MTVRLPDRPPARDESAPQPTHAPSELRLPARTSHLHEAREHVRRAATALGLGSRHREELVYAVNEAVTNAIRHGEPDGSGMVHVHVARTGGEVQVAVRDSGSFAAPGAPAAPDAEHGRGFALMASFVDDIRISTAPGVTIVTLCKALE